MMAVEGDIWQTTTGQCLSSRHSASHAMHCWSCLRETSLARVTCFHSASANMHLWFNRTIQAFWRLPRQPSHLGHGQSLRRPSQCQNCQLAPRSAHPPFQSHWSQQCLHGWVLWMARRPLLAWAHAAANCPALRAAADSRWACGRLQTIAPFIESVSLPDEAMHGGSSIKGNANCPINLHTQLRRAAIANKGQTQATLQVCV